MRVVLAVVIVMAYRADTWGLLPIAHAFVTVSHSKGFAPTSGIAMIGALDVTSNLPGSSAIYRWP